MHVHAWQPAFSTLSPTFWTWPHAFGPLRWMLQVYQYIIQHYFTQLTHVHVLANLPQLTLKLLDNYCKCLSVAARSPFKAYSQR